MPNWCSNTIVVSGNDLTKFREFLGDGEGFLSKIAPTPQPLVDTVSGWSGNPEEQKKVEEQQAANLLQYGFKDWYDWNIGTWGTKWDVNAEIDDGSSIDTQIIFSFESAWAPPQKAISLLAQKFPELSFRHSFLEEGMGFVGVDEYEQGGVSNQDYSEDSDSEEWKCIATEEFNWQPWQDDVVESEPVVEVTKPVEKPAKKKVKKAVKKVKKPTKKLAKKKKKAKKK